MQKSFSENRIKLLCFLLPLVVISIYIVELKNCTFSLLNQTFQSYIYYANGTDMANYFDNADNFYKGEWPAGAFYRAPLYSFFIIFISLFTKQIISVIFIQSLLLLSTIYITYQITKEVFSNSAALLTILFLTMYGGFIFWVAIPHSTVLETTLTILSFFTLIRLRKRFNNKNISIAAITGAILCLIRPNFLIIVPSAIFLITIEKMMTLKRSKLSSNKDHISLENSTLSLNNIEWKNNYQLIGTLCLGALCFLLPLLPLLIWNNLHSDTFVLFTTNGAATFKIANSYDSVIYNFIYPKMDAIPLFSIDFIQHQAGKFLGFWNSIEFPQNVNFYIYRSRSWLLTILPLNFAIIGSLFIAATLFFIFSWKKYWLFIWFIWGYIFTVVIFFIIGRFRIPVVPLMVILDVAFIFKIIQFIKISRKHKRRIKFTTKLKTYVSLILFIIIFIFSNPSGYYIHQQGWMNVSNKYLYGMDLAGYVNALREKEVNRDISMILNICAAETFQGDFRDAERDINILINSNPNNLYFQKTKKEILLLKQIKLGQIPAERWYRYITEENSPAHITRFYHTLTSILQKRRFFELSTNAKWLLPVSFFREPSQKENNGN